MHNHLQHKLDFLIIGAGPAGLLTTIQLLQSGEKYSIGLVDKKNPWQEPVACAEAVHKTGLATLVPKVENSWIRETIDGVIFVAPDRTEVKFIKKASGIIINRALMHKDLANECIRGGAQCNFKTKIRTISAYENGYRTVSYTGETTGKLQAKVVIDCSGPGSRFGKTEAVTQGNYDLEPAIFTLAQGISYPANFIQLFFGKCYAPGGYAWLFPRDDGTANIGLVIGRKYSKSTSLKKSLSKFLDECFPGAKTEPPTGGAIACGYSQKPFAADNLLKVGDAANMVNPISRSGILEAMYGGHLAAETALQIIKLNSEIQKKPFYQSYQQKWVKKYGKHHHHLNKAKNAFGNIKDEVFSSAAQKLTKISPEKMTMRKIFLTTLFSNPLLFWHMRGMILK